MKNKINILVPALRKPDYNREILLQRLSLNIQLLNCVNSREEYEHLQKEIIGIFGALFSYQLNSHIQENVI